VVGESEARVDVEALEDLFFFYFEFGGGRSAGGGESERERKRKEEREEAGRTDKEGRKTRPTRERRGKNLCLSSLPLEGKQFRVNYASGGLRALFLSTKGNAEGEERPCAGSNAGWEGENECAFFFDRPSSMPSIFFPSLSFSLSLYLAHAKLVRVLHHHHGRRAAAARGGHGAGATRAVNGVVLPGRRAHENLSLFLFFFFPSRKSERKRKKKLPRPRPLLSISFSRPPFSSPFLSLFFLFQFNRSSTVLLYILYISIGIAT